MTSSVARVGSVLRRGRSLAGNTLWVAAGDLVTLVAGLIVFYALTTELGPAGYGYFVGAQVLIAALATFCSTSVAMLLMQEVVREQREVNEVWRGCLGLASTGSVLASFLALPLGAALLPGLSLRVLALFTLAQLFGAGLTTLASAFEQTQGRFPRGMAINACPQVLRAISVMLMAATEHMSLLNVAVMFCAVNLSCAAVALVLMQVSYGLSASPRRPTVADARRGSAYAGALLLFSVQEDADKLLLVRLADASTNGLYATAYRFVQMATLPVRAMVQASHPGFLRHDPGRTGEHVGRSLRMTAVGASYGVFAVVVLLFVAPLAAEVLGEEYVESVHLVQLLAPLVLLRALASFASNALMGLGRNGFRLALAGSGAVINVALNVWLIIEHGAVGAAVATLCAEVAFVVLTWAALLWCQRSHDDEVRARRQAAGDAAPARSGA